MCHPFAVVPTCRPTSRAASVLGIHRRSAAAHLATSRRPQLPAQAEGSRRTATRPLTRCESSSRRAYVRPGARRTASGRSCRRNWRVRRWRSWMDSMMAVRTQCLASSPYAEPIPFRPAGPTEATPHFPLSQARSWPIQSGRMSAVRSGSLRLLPFLAVHSRQSGQFGDGFRICHFAPLRCGSQRIACVLTCTGSSIHLP